LGCVLSRIWRLGSWRRRTSGSYRGIALNERALIDYRNGTIATDELITALVPLPEGEP
jgi:hypothetical protein